MQHIIKKQKIILIKTKFKYWVGPGAPLNRIRSRVWVGCGVVAVERGSAPPKLWGIGQNCGSFWSTTSTKCAWVAGSIPNNFHSLIENSVLGPKCDL